LVSLSGTGEIATLVLSFALMTKFLGEFL